MRCVQPRRILPGLNTMLTLNNIEVTYSNVILVLRGVSLQVPKGQIVALLGANGAGKSTTVKIGAGLLAPTAGTVSVAGHDVTGVHLALSLTPRSVRSGARGCCTLEDARDARRAADVLGIPVGTAGSRLHYAKRALRRVLENDND